MNTLSYLRGRRLWVVRDFNIWGNPNDIELLYLGLENLGSSSRMMFGKSSLGGSSQDVNFADLSDWRGNRLPSTINSPWIIISPKSEYAAFVVGDQSNSGFRIARASNAPGAVTADLYIYELGD